MHESLSHCVHTFNATLKWVDKNEIGTKNIRKWGETLALKSIRATDWLRQRKKWYASNIKTLSLLRQQKWNNKREKKCTQFLTSKRANNRETEKVSQTDIVVDQMNRHYFAAAARASHFFIPYKPIQSCWIRVYLCAVRVSLNRPLKTNTAALYVVILLQPNTIYKWIYTHLRREKKPAAATRTDRKYIVDFPQKFIHLKNFQCVFFIFFLVCVVARCGSCTLFSIRTTLFFCCCCCWNIFICVNFTYNLIMSINWFICRWDCWCLLLFMYLSEVMPHKCLRLLYYLSRRAYVFFLLVCLALN